MAGADIGGGGKGGRVSIYIDMTPMVDVIILLLIFFFMTSQFKEPMGVEISLPSKAGSMSTVKVKQSNVLTIKVDETGKIAVIDKRNPEPGVEKPLEGLNEYIGAAQQENKDLITIIDVSPEAPYSRMVDVLDEFKLASEQTKNRKISLVLGEAPGGTAATAAPPAKGK
jgi:biopolymer transport protein ExbD